jgi:predicted nucleotidyltransferase
MASREKLLETLVEKLRRALAERVISIILYGSAAAGEYDAVFSDLNILCVLDRLTAAELEAAEPVFHWWREPGNPAPLLLTDAEAAASADCFPIEFTDMLDRRRILFGRDVIEGMAIDRRFYRAQVEYELRTKLIRLRQKAPAAFLDRDMLVALMADSASTFLVLARHALILSGHPAPGSRHETVEGLRERFGIDPASFEQMLAVREGRMQPRSVDARAAFTRYLAGIQSLVEAVDLLDAASQP